MKLTKSKQDYENKKKNLLEKFSLIEKKLYFALNVYKNQIIPILSPNQIRAVWVGYNSPELFYSF